MIKQLKNQNLSPTAPQQHFTISAMPTSHVNTEPLVYLVTGERPSSRFSSPVLRCQDADGRKHSLSTDVNTHRHTHTDLRNAFMYVYIKKANTSERWKNFKLLCNSCPTSLPGSVGNIFEAINAVVQEKTSILDTQLLLLCGCAEQKQSEILQNTVLRVAVEQVPTRRGRRGIMRQKCFTKLPLIKSVLALPYQHCLPIDIHTDTSADNGSD